MSPISNLIKLSIPTSTKTAEPAEVLLSECGFTEYSIAHFGRPVIRMIPLVY